MASTKRLRVGFVSPRLTTAFRIILATLLTSTGVPASRNTEENDENKVKTSASSSIIGERVHNHVRNLSLRAMRCDSKAACS